MGNQKCEFCGGTFPLYMLIGRTPGKCRICDSIDTMKNNVSEIKTNIIAELMLHINKLELRIIKLEKDNACKESIKESGIEQTKGEEFRTVGRRDKKKKKTSATPDTDAPIKLDNRYKVLKGLQSNDDHNINLISDEIGLGMTTEFCGRNPVKRRNYCHRKVKVDTIISCIPTDLKKGDKLIITACQQDLLENKVDRKKLISKYKEMITNLKEHRGDTLICGVLPVQMENEKFLNHAFNLNRELKFVCRDMNVKFANYWDEFYDKKYVNGSSITELGAARLGRLLQNSCVRFFPNPPQIRTTP